MLVYFTINTLLIELNIVLKSDFISESQNKIFFYNMEHYIFVGTWAYISDESLQKQKLIVATWTKRVCVNFVQITNEF